MALFKLQWTGFLHVTVPLVRLASFVDPACSTTSDRASRVPGRAAALRRMRISAHASANSNIEELKEFWLSISPESRTSLTSVPLNDLAAAVASMAASNAVNSVSKPTEACGEGIVLQLHRAIVDPAATELAIRGNELIDALNALRSSAVPEGTLLQLLFCLHRSAERQSAAASLAKLPDAPWSFGLFLSVTSFFRRTPISL